uniref:B-like cyclin n=1 Tax=Quercus lobata TaxID=97700 RepID=A0A7N2LU60_QUELO
MSPREMEFELEDPLTSFQDHQSDTVLILFTSESDHMPSQNFLISLKTSDSLASFRREFISYMSQFARNLDPFVPYLAVNYMDRFISKQEIPQGKPWVLRLLVVSCLSLAAKMKNTPLSLSDFMREEDCIFDAQAINKMELLILDALEWRMRSITPFPFLQFFLSLSKFQDPTLIQALKRRASELIIHALNEIKLLEYKPSIIAASALLSASHELFTLQFTSFKASILSCEYVNKENLMKCFNMLQGMVAMEGYDSSLDYTVSSTSGPLSLLDCHCTKWECNNSTVGPEKIDIKRRKLNGVCYQISQIQHSRWE